jgi:hypothetical protein
MNRRIAILALASMFLFAGSIVKADPQGVPKKAKVEVIVGERAIYVKITLPTADVIVREVKK